VNKKKLIVIGVLGAVLLAVGVFQFTSSSEPQPSSSPKPPSAGADAGAPAKTADGDNTDPAAVDDPIRKLYVQALPTRDPFQRLGAELEGEPLPKGTSTLRPTPPAVPPMKLDGVLPDLNGSLPTGLTPGAPLRRPGEFAYTLSGVILGSRPAAVFTDDSGNQKLVLLGSAVDGDSRLVGLTKGHATISHQGKTLTFSVGGNPNAN
jgi:hypothetical protein